MISSSSPISLRSMSCGKRVLLAYQADLELSRRRYWQASLAHIRCKVRPGYDFDVPLLPGDHVTDDTGTGFVHTAPGHGREDFDIWTANARSLTRAASTRHTLYRRCRRPLHRSGAGLHRQARAHRKRREGRCQRGGDQGVDRSRHADRARAAQASISAFMALEEADHLPQHAAMVHRDGSRTSPSADDTLRHRALDRDQGDPLGAGGRAKTASAA